MTPDYTTEPSEARDDYKRIADMGRAALPTETNAEVERDADRQGRSTTARELRDCIALLVHGAATGDEELSCFSIEMQSAASYLLPSLLRVAALREQADEEFAEIVEETGNLVDYLDALAEIDYLLSLGVA